MKNKLKTCVPLIVASISLTACGESPDTDQMISGLQKNGMGAEMAQCVAKEAKSAKGEAYNYLAMALTSGDSINSALNRVRRKYGPDEKGALQDAINGCK